MKVLALCLSLSLSLSLAHTYGQVHATRRTKRTKFQLHLRSPTVARGHELKVSSLTAQHPTFRVARVQRFVGQVLLFPQGHEQDAVGAPNLGNIEDKIRLPNPGQVISPWLAPIRTRARCFFASFHPVVLETRSFPGDFAESLLSTYKSYGSDLTLVTYTVHHFHLDHIASPLVSTDSL